MANEHRTEYHLNVSDALQCMGAAYEETEQRQFFTDMANTRATLALASAVMHLAEQLETPFEEQRQEITPLKLLNFEGE